jgi:AcrR family transcriptional regulator
MALQIDKAARADQAADAALAMFLEQPREAVTIEALAERAGLTYWQVHRFHGNARNLFRAAVARLIQRIENRLSGAPADPLSVGDGVRRYTAYAAEIMQDEAYGQFVYLLIRDRCVEPMLEEAYESRIASPLRAGLERLVRSFGLDHGMMILLGANSSREFVKSLEAEFVLPRLLPGFVAPDAEMVSAAVRRIADRVVAASYVLGSQAA